MLVELPGIEPVSRCWSGGQNACDLLNNITCNSLECRRLAPKCAQIVPTAPRGANLGVAVQPPGYRPPGYRLCFRTRILGITWTDA
jgi:hypothetical protein